MKFIDKKISESYYQIYIILDTKEKINILNNIKNEIFLTKKEELIDKIKLYKNLNKTSNSDSTKNKLKSLEEQLSLLNIKTIKYSQKELEDLLYQELMKDIYNHMESLKLIQVFGNDLSIIGSFDDNNSLTIIYSFCYIDYNKEIIYPKQKGNGYLFTSKDIDIIQTELLIYNKMYERLSVEKVSEFSDIQFTYRFGKNTDMNLCLDINEIESKLLIDRSEFIGLTRGLNLIYTNNKQPQIIDIKEIYDKNVYDITDDMVKIINYENTKTVRELRKLIKDIYSVVYNVKSNIFSILENMVMMNNFYIDKYVYKHYAKQMEEDVKEEYTQEEINEIKTAFITSYIFSKYEIKIDPYVYYIEHEHKLFYKIKSSKENLTLEEYFNMRAPYYALYEFFKSKNLVTERSNDE